ncbi:hypothetical protein H5410_052991 [Solanum commersonii]|uniref:Uncharacterized protein n=1 Tax=Solanum commersonii TaxID=4109 RepID=A0A9J5X500_SOLCO|nr:hypothetical protein H5410_052991 [Solanum commersonii]
MTHFKGRTILGAGNPPYLANFRVLKTLAMELVGPDNQDIPFSRSNEPRCRQTPYFAYFWTLAMEQVGPNGQNGPIPWSNDPRSRQWIFDDLEF